MNTHFWLLTVQYITVAALFAEVLMVFLRGKNGIHSYLLLACVASFVSNIGYLFELLAGSEEAYITAKLIEGIDNNNALKRDLQRKLASVYDSTSIGNYIDNSANAANVEALAAAIKHRKPAAVRAEM